MSKDNGRLAASGNLSRRGFLAASVVGLGTFALASCAPPSSGGSFGPAGNSAELPTLVRPTALKPDLPGTAEGVSPGYFSYPEKLITTVEEAPGSGKAMSSMITTFAPVPAQSQYFDAVNEALNVPLDLITVPSNDYPQRFSTVVAGGDLPHTMEIIPWMALPRIGDFLKAKCIDLSEYLSGDAVKKYPNLAAIPTQSWNSSRVNGRLYGVPIPRNVFYNGLFYRKDLVDAKGVDLPKDADEFIEFCKSLTTGGSYALGGAAPDNPFNFDFVRGMFNVPNGWREDGGTLTYYIETDEFTESVEYLKGLWDAGVFHPNSASFKGSEGKDLFYTGGIHAFPTSNAGWKELQRNGRGVDPNLLVDQVPQIGKDGGAGVNYLGGGSFGYTVVTNAAKDRLEEVLGILNYLAAPFGSEEYHLINYGIEGVHHTPSPNGPVLTDLGKTEVINSYSYLTAPEQVLFDAEFVDEFVKPAHKWQSALAPNLLASPTTGFNSETESKVGASLNTQINDTVTSVVLGRKPVSALDDLAKTWASGGGDKIRSEYEKALAQA